MEFYLNNKPVKLRELIYGTYIRLEGSLLRGFKPKKGEPKRRCKIRVVVRKSPLITDAPTVEFKDTVYREGNTYYIEGPFPADLEIPDENFRWTADFFLDVEYRLSYLNSLIKVREVGPEDIDVEGQETGFRLDFAGNHKMVPFMPLAQVFPLARAFALEVAEQIQSALEVELARLRGREDAPSRFVTLLEDNHDARVLSVF